MTLQEYLDTNKLWDEASLGAHCQTNMVYVKTSLKYPGLVLLHYSDEASYGRGWNEFNTMCRGAILDMRTKQVLAWPFNKFYNLGEHTSTYEAVMAKGDFIATEKLDGSMLILFAYEGKNYFTTKGSFDSDHAAYVNSIMPRGIDTWNLDGCTYMFELIDSKFRNVIDYKKRGYADGIYLTGIRCKDHTLASSMYLTEFAELYGLNTYKTYKAKDLESIVKNCETLPSCEEGYVLKFDNEQFLVKVKGKDYLIAHKIMTGMNDNAIVEAILEGKRDELILYCPEEYRDEVIARFGVFEQAAKELRQHINTVYALMRPKVLVERKEFAAYVIGSVLPEYRKFMFKLFDGADEVSITKMVYQHLKEHRIKDGKYIPS